MASGRNSKIITLNALVGDQQLPKVDRSPTLMLRSSSSSTSPSFSQVNIVLRKNRAKLDQLFDAMQTDINKKLQEKREQASKAMEYLTPSQQDQLLSFWGGLCDVFKALFDWIDRVLNNLIDMLRKGWTLVKETTKAFFQTIVNWFKNLG